MIIQAGALQSGVSRQHPVAGTQLVQLVQQLNGIFDRRSTGIRTEIAGLILLHGTGKQDSGIIFPHRHLDIRVRLVILQQSVIFRRILFDQIVLQHQCLQFGVRHDIFKSRDQ